MNRIETTGSLSSRTAAGFQRRPVIKEINSNQVQEKENENEAGK